MNTVRIFNVEELKHLKSFVPSDHQLQYKRIKFNVAFSKDLNQQRVRG